ncbi:MAG: MBOAT family protein [Lachnospiraceae bacterium]|nr:MBOAT family protein [Lachnospiraceae bacterium]
MALSSGGYFIFLAVCVAVYRALPARFHDVVLLVASVAFYLYAMPRMAVWIMLYAFLVWLAGLFAAQRTGGARAVTVIAVAGTVLYLFFVKYAEPVLSVFPGELEKTPFFSSIVAPVGISYITFQAIAYLVEVSKRSIRPEVNMVRFFLYLLFFAKITAGPIEPPEAFLSQLHMRHRMRPQKIARGLLLLMRGLLRKIVIADVLAEGVNAVYANPAAHSGFEAIFAVLLYSAQIYYDFAGYTDLARGSAALFGIDLTENFDRPYGAETIREFWGRWHMSLSSWLREYIYIPLGGSRCGMFRRCVNLLLTFLVSGIWHGASLTFVIWGFLHGLFQMLGVLYEWALRARGGQRKKSAGMPHMLRVVRTYLLVTFNWIFFRADTLSDVWAILTRPLDGMGSFLQSMTAMGLTPATLLLFAVTLLAIRALDSALIEPLEKEGIRGVPGTRRLAFLAVLTVWTVFLVQSTMQGESAAFIYFGF